MHVVTKCSMLSQAFKFRARRSSLNAAHLFLLRFCFRKRIRCILVKKVSLKGVPAFYVAGSN